MPDDVYTHGHAEPVLRSHRWRTIANSAAHLVPELVAGRSLLDVGCGPGTITVEFADRLAPGPVVGIDRAEEVLAAARREAGDRANLRFELGDVYALPFEDDSFDIVHAHQVLQHLTDPVAALVEMARVCRPGGVVAARDADYGAFFWAPASAGLDRWRTAYRAVARRNGAEPDAGRYLAEWAMAAGLTDVEVSFDAWTFADEETRRWWGGLWADRVTDSALGAQMVDYGIATTDERDAMAAAFRAWSAEPAGVFVVPNGEILARVPGPSTGH